jgi:aminobenzoyl-glutamate transport protein
LIGAVMRMLVLKSPRALLTPVVVFCGVLSNAASEVGYVLLVPLAALIFKAAGRHPVLGLAAAFAGVSGGYSANFVLGTIDPLLAGLSQEAARIIDPTYVVSPAANYYFMFVSTFLITGLGWWVTERLVAPRLGAIEAAPGTEPADDAANDAVKPLTAAERRGLKFAFAGFVLLTTPLLWGLLPADGFLREAGTALLLGAACGVVVGLIAWIWRGTGLEGFVIGASIFLSLCMACFLGLTVPTVLHALKLDPKVAAGPVTLALTDIFTLLFYFGLATLFLVAS